jgi:hypothetical protein
MNKQFNFMHLIIFNIRNNWALILFIRVRSDKKNRTYKARSVVKKYLKIKLPFLPFRLSGF